MIQALTDYAAFTQPITDAWNLFMAHSIFGVVVFFIIFGVLFALFYKYGGFSPWKAVVAVAVAFVATALLINGLYNNPSLTLLFSH